MDRLSLATLAAAFGRLGTIEHPDPELTPENWCAVQPCRTVTLGSKKILLTQPASTFFVYALGLLTAGVGLYFWRLPGAELSSRWWGIALALWGAGALLAGTSYQAFGYQIKCAGRERCAWTSWWEVIYLILQQASMDALLVAVAYSRSDGPPRALLLGYALAVAVVYAVVTLAGALIPRKPWITFERMVWVSTPGFLAGCALNGWRYLAFGEPLDLVLLGAWALLVLTMAAYWLYDRLDLTHKLWARGEGIWFSQNDVLHIGLILWMIYLATLVAPHIHD